MAWQAYLFNGYWEDIGTIKSFFDANLALTDQALFLLLLSALNTYVFHRFQLTHLYTLC